jgi:hypothetical protein
VRAAECVSHCTSSMARTRFTTWSWWARLILLLMLALGINPGAHFVQESRLWLELHAVFVIIPE